MEDYPRNLTTLLDTAKAFDAFPGIHMGFIEGWLLDKPGCIADINNITDAERAEAETQTSDVVKAALLISGADKRRYGGLNNDLGNNYSFFLSFFWSGHRGSKAYSLWGGVIPYPSIGYDYP